MEGSSCVRLRMTFVGGFCSIIGNITAAHMWRHGWHIPVRRRGSRLRRGGSQEGASLCKAPSWVAFLLHASLAKQRSMAAGGSSEHARKRPPPCHSEERSDEESLLLLCSLSHKILTSCRCGFSRFTGLCFAKHLLSQMKSLRSTPPLRGSAQDDIRSEAVAAQDDMEGRLSHSLSF